MLFMTSIIIIYYIYITTMFHAGHGDYVITSSLPEKGRGIHEIIRSKFKVGLKSSLKCSK